MPSLRKHPERYDQRLYANMRSALQGNIVRNVFITADNARAHRMLLYAARASLLQHPTHDRELATHCKKVVFKLEDRSILYTIKKDFKDDLPIISD